jgi:CRISPR/Cas system CSM-associated protein Csm3 (group 7 of RAMP superfamily)
MTALFTAGYWYGGQGTLRIRILREEASILAEQLLMAALQDLSLGLMTLGGNASTGLGQIRIIELKADGKPCELHAEVKKFETLT